MTPAEYEAEKARALEKLCETDASCGVAEAELLQKMEDAPEQIVLKPRLRSSMASHPPPSPTKPSWVDVALTLVAPRSSSAGAPSKLRQAAPPPSLPPSAPGEMREPKVPLPAQHSHPARHSHPSRQRRQLRTEATVLANRKGTIIARKGKQIASGLPGDGLGLDGLRARGSYFVSSPSLPPLKRSLIPPTHPLIHLPTHAPADSA